MNTTTKNFKRISIQRDITPFPVLTHISVKIFHDSQMKGYLVTWVNDTKTNVDYARIS
jgi:hypothetical protein